MNRNFRALTAVCLWIVSLAAWAPAVRAQEIDLSEYTPLLNRSIEAHMAAQGASEEARGPLLEEAIARDTALIDWLQALLVSPQFEQLDTTTQTAYATGHARAEFNRAAALIQVRRCDEARERVAALLARAQIEPELRAALTALGSEAVACAESPDAEAADASDSAETIPATSESAPPAETESTTAATEATPPAEAEPRREEVEPRREEGGKSPLWYEWTLWGVGAAGIGTALVFFFIASDIEDQLAEHPPEEVADPEGEQDLADQNYVTAYVLGGIGLAAAITGTVLYLVRDEDGPRPQVSAGPWLQQGLGLSVAVRF